MYIFTNFSLLLRLSDVQEVRFNDITQDFILQKSPGAEWDSINDEVLQILLTADASSETPGSLEELEMCTHWTQDDLIISGQTSRSLLPDYVL